jgi:glycosyltransferase involved in cell wall biosynthesis
MKVVIISTNDIHGGAARAAYRLHEGLNMIGLNSFMLVKNKNTHDDRVLQVKASESKTASIDLNIINIIQRQYIDQNRTSLTNTKFTFPYPGYDLSGLEIIKQADIINMHFIASFQSCESIRKLLSSGKPVVWTLHDQWAFTGGCHYSAGCDQYKTDCLGCPQLKNDPHHLPHQVLTHKRSLIDKSRLFIVTPSKWLSKAARESFLFRDLTCEVIPNAVETDIFCPVGDKGESKKKYNIPDDVVTILFGAVLGSIKRKGFDKLREAIETCYKNRKFRKLVKKKKINLLCFGTPSSDIEKLNIPYKSFGKISSDYDLRDIYNAADFFVLPSLEDNLPNTMLEAMSCGTPLVAFNIGGIPDVVTDNETGRLVTPFDTGQFAEAIMDLTFNEKKRKILGYNSRKLIENHYHLQAQAQKYRDLFTRISPQKMPRKSSLSLPPDRILTCELDVTLPEKFPGLYEEFASA